MLATQRYRTTNGGGGAAEPFKIVDVTDEPEHQVSIAAR